MSTTLAPLDKTISIADLTRDPYPIYRRLRAETPVLRVAALGRTVLTKAADTRLVKDNPVLFSSDDPNTPMKRAFQAHTLMRKDGAAHQRERGAMAPAFSAAAIRANWLPVYRAIAEDYVGRLPRGETVDLFQALAGPFAARCLAHLLGITAASDAELQRWSQALIDGAGNYGWQDAPFVASDRAHKEMNACFDKASAQHRAAPGPSALSVMVNAGDPIETAQIYANIKIAIGGGINEPRDALATILYGLLTNPDQLAHIRQTENWAAAFEEGVRWVAPIQVSARLVKEDTELRGFVIPKGDVVMTIQASANRDEELYGDGEAFDIFRPKAPHQAFGNGPHFCQGMHIARQMLTTILLPMLFDRFPNMSLPAPEDVVWRGFAFRGPINLPVRLA